MESHQPYCSIFLFINSGSGGGVGQELVQQEVQKMSFNLNLEQVTGNKEDQVEVYFYNMRKNKEKGFNRLKLLTDAGKKCISVVCGGDGTVMWVISQLVKHKIDIQKSPITVIPLGTGNDFSRCLGWGKQQTSLTENSFLTLKQLIKDWLSASEENLDIWNVSAKVYDYGSFEKVVDQKDKKLEQKQIRKDFCNYFSFGIDGKVGYQFDKNRTNSRLGNLFVYGTMGIVSNFQKTKTMGELIELILDYSDNKGEVIFHGQKVKSAQELFGNNIFDIKINWGEVVENVKNALSLNNYQNIVALNINSYMAGVKDIWKKAGEVELMKKNITQTVETNHSDGVIELVSFASTLTIGLEKAVNKFSQVGFSQKVGQGSGPFYFKFRKQEDIKNDNITYLQIDGQFIRVNHLDFIQLKKSSQIPGGRIRVLHKSQKPAVQYIKK